MGYTVTKRDPESEIPGDLCKSMAQSVGVFIMTKKKGFKCIGVDRGHLYTNRQYAHPIVSIFAATERRERVLPNYHVACIHTYSTVVTFGTP